MNEKDLPAFQQELKDGGETKHDEKQPGECQNLSEKVKVCDKPGRSCSFVRTWGGWEIGGE